MTTSVRATTRDGWADAAALATHAVLDPDAASARRRAWLRRALLIVVGAAVFGSAYVVAGAVIGLDAMVTPVWDAPRPVPWSGSGLAGLGLLLIILSNARSSAAGIDRSFVGPVDLLPHADRAWVRRQISAGSAVPRGRRAVVAATARRLSDEGRTWLLQVGQVCVLLGLALSVPVPLNLVAMTGLTVWTLVDAIRAQLLARRARRWLTQHG